MADKHKQNSANSSNPQILGESGKRIIFIDVSRGLLIAWMIISHSLGRAQISGDHILQWFRPHGWATFGFVMISGFSLGYLFKQTNDNKISLRSKIWKRAFQIGAAAYFSNLAFLTAKAYLSGDFNIMLFFNIASFQHPWGYSAILIPTTLLLLIAPFLLNIASRHQPSYLLIVTTIIISIVDTLLQTAPSSWQLNPFFQALFLRNDLTIFPIGSLLLYAIWTFFFANWLKHPSSQKHKWIITVIAGCILFTYIRTITPYSSSNPGFFAVASRFPIILIIGIAICNMPFLTTIRNALGRMGRSALLVYIFHRPFLQLLDVSLSGSLTKIELACTLMLICLAVSITICILKERNPGFRRRLKLIGF
ncbi:MAG: DUF1624 domain-containing protein [Aestuariibacter sp.]|nr:DUF1624 domain-containing protein [Aestuariibacter sp.]